MNALKKLFVACAAAVIPASAAWAVNMDGVYVGERKGEPIVITMRGEGRIDGTVQQGSGPAAPLVGEERNGEIRAAFRGPSGNPVQINGRWDGTALRLEAGGEWIVFKKTGAPAAAVAAPAAPVNPLDDAGAPRGVAVNPLDDAGPARGAAVRREPAPATPAAPAAAPDRPALPAGLTPEKLAELLRGTPVQGEIFRYALPGGWDRIETSNELKAYSTNGAAVFGFCGVEGTQVPNNAGFLAQMAQGARWENVRVVHSWKIEAGRGQEAAEALITFTFRNQPFYGWVRTLTVFGGGLNNCYMLYAAGTPLAWEHTAQHLVRLAEQIQITNANLVFQRAHRAAVLNNRNLNQPMDHGLVTGGYWKTQETYANISARRSDVTLGSYGVTDPTTGQRGHVPAAAIDPATNTVRDPVTGRDLPLDPHWQQNRQR